MTVCLPIDWPAPPAGAGLVGSLVFTGMTVCAVVLAAGIIARSATMRLSRAYADREQIAQHYGSSRTYLFFATLAAFAVCLLCLGWGATATELGSITFGGRRVLIPGGELLILAPFLIAQIGSWFFFYDADLAFHRIGADPLRSNRFWSRYGYVVFVLRQQLILVFAPLFLLMAQQAVERLYPEILSQSWLPFASLFIIPSVLVLFPVVLPLLLGLQPLPAGPVRDRLEANSRRLRFRYAQIHLWDTRGAMANAMVVGIVRWIRYVVFTDRLLEELSEDQVDGVFGHEVGHAHYGHMLYYGLFLMLSFMLMGAILPGMRIVDETAYNDHPTLFLIAPVALMGVYMFAAFGFISRRCERQADIFGCRAGSCSNPHCRGHDWTTVLAEEGRGLCPTGIANFISALRRVEEINGMNRPRPAWRGTGLFGKLNWVFRLLTGWLHTWQHSTISKRVAFLERVSARMAIERQFQWRLWIMKWLIMIILVGGLIAVACWKGWAAVLLTR